MNPKFPRPAHSRALASLSGHALLEVYQGFPVDRQDRISKDAERMVEDVATSTQDRKFLTGDPAEDWPATNAIFGNALLMLIRFEQDQVRHFKKLGDMIHERGNIIATLKREIKKLKAAGADT